MSTTTPPVINYTQREFATIYAELKSFVEASRPEDQTDFFASSLGTMLIELVAYVGDLISFGQDRLAEEVFLATARRYESALRFARSVGFVPRSALAASTTLRATTLPTAVVTEGGRIAAGSFVVGLNGLRYEVVDDAIVPPGSSVASIAVKQGQSFEEEFTPTKAGSQEFTTARGIVEQDSWDVYVGETDDVANLWTQVSNVLFEVTATQTYEVFFDGDGKLTIRFGDGNSGKIPDATVTLRYRTTDGSGGNTALNTIRGNFQITTLTSQLNESLAVANTVAAATGGQDRETVEELRVSIPSFIRSVDKVIAIRDYESGLLTQAGVALVFADVPIASFSGNVVRVHVWDTQQVNLTSTSPTSGATSIRPYQQYVQVPTTRIQPIQAYLAPRTISTVHNIIVRPTVANVDLDFGIVHYDRVRKRDDVHQDIVDAVIALFENSSGFAIRIADIYKAVLAVPSVSYFTIKTASFERIDPDNAPTVITTNYHKDPQANPGTFPLVDFTIIGAANRAYYDDTFLYNNEILYNANVEDTSIQAINLRTLTFELQA